MSKKLVLNIVSGLLAVVGIIWILQGADILQGSSMTGQSQWLFAGIVCVVISAGIQAYMRRSSRI